MPIWNPQHEKMDRVDMAQLQLERLQTTLNRAYRNVPFYHSKLSEANVVPEDVQSLCDVTKLPFTTRGDLQSGYPYQMFAVPLREIVRIHSTPGTSSKPVVAGYTRNDIEHWAELVARILSAAGVTKDDVVQIAFDYGLLTDGFGMHYGAERLGATVIPASSGNTKMQANIMRDFRTTTIVSTPGYALNLVDVMCELGLSYAALCLRVGVFGGESMSDDMRLRLESGLGITAIDTYGMGSPIGPGVAGECELKCGLHIQDDHFMCEIIDPVALHPLSDGEDGELVVTTLSREGLPMVRFKTGDITSLTHEPCLCGRTTARMSPVRKRTDDMIAIGGVQVYPSEIRNILAGIEHVEPHCQLVIDREGGRDCLTVNIEIASTMISDQMVKLEELQDSIGKKLQSTLGIAPKVRLVESNTIQQTVNLVIDNR